MSIQSKPNSLRLPALVSSISLLIMTLAAAFSYGFVHSQILVNTDPLLTFSNLKEASVLFKGEIIGWFVIIITDILVSWGFYLFFLKTDSKIATLGAIFRLSYVAILIIAVIKLIHISAITLSSNTSSNTINSPITQEQVMALFQQFDHLWSLGLILFGFHLIFIGFLTLKANQVPNLLGILLIIAGTSYVFIHIMHSFFPELQASTATLEHILGLPMAVGELSFGIWLWAKGGK